MGTGTDQLDATDQINPSSRPQIKDNFERGGFSSSGGVKTSGIVYACADIIEVDASNGLGGIGINGDTPRVAWEARDTSDLQLMAATQSGSWWKLGRDNSTGDFHIEDDGLGVVMELLQTTGQIQVPGSYTTTTASAANVNIDATGLMARSTSSQRYKKDIEDLDLELSEKLLDELELIFYRSKCIADNQEWSYYGILAERLAEIDPRYVFWGYFDEDFEIVDYEKEIIFRINDKDGNIKNIPKKVSRKKRILKKGAELKPVGVQYERLVVPLAARSKLHKNKINELEAKVDKLMKMMEKKERKEKKDD